MGVSSSIGPVSGIDYGKLITGLTSLDQQPIDAITNQLNTLDQKNQALLDLSTLLTGLKVSAASFTSSAIFRAAQATTANPAVLNATAGIGTPVGNYSFNVQQLASASQVVTQGFSSSTTALGLSGNISLRIGGGDLDQSASLSALNGGKGVARGSIKITDRAGQSALIDLSHAVGIQDVVDAINSSTGVSVSAAISGDHLVLTDNTGGAGTLTVANAGGTTTASDLGLTAPSAGATLTGATLTALQSNTSLNSLNDGNGVRAAGILNDFSITGSAGTLNVSLNGAKTLGDVISRINASSSADGVVAAISSDGTGISLNDSTGAAVTVSALNGSLAASDLGILGTGAAGTITGDRIASALQGPLIKDLNGGSQGGTTPQFGTILINGQSVDLSGARTLTDVLNTINASGQGVTAALDGSDTGVVLSSNASAFTVADGTGNLASFLHIAGSSNAQTTGSQIASGDLHLQYISGNTALSSLNGGAGISLGQIQITGPTLVGNGSASLTIDLSNATTIGDVLNRLNSTGLAISARINDTGDGILVSQTSGTTQAAITDLNGSSTAKSLGIAGTFSGNQINGSFQKSISIAASDSLSDIATKINNANAGVSVSIINDGSGTAPFRLSLSSRNSGKAGRLVFNGAAAGLNGTTLVQGEDAVLVYGGNANGTGGILTTSSKNAISKLVPGLTLNLTGVGSTSVSVTNDTSKIDTAVQGFVDAYNKVNDNLTQVTAFNASDQTKNGVLFGDSNVQQVSDALGSFLTQRYTGNFNSLAAVGITVGLDGSLTLDSNKLDQALASDPDGVRTLFTTNINSVAGGPHTLNSSTLLSSLATTGFPTGQFTITDGFGTAHTIDLSTGVSSIGDVISRINAGAAGTVTATLNTTGDGILLTQVGGPGNATVSDLNGGSTAAALNLRGTFANGTLNGEFPPIQPVNANKGVGQTLSDLLDRFTNAQTGLLFDASTSIQNQETELKDRQQSLSDLLTAKKNAMIQQFANLEVTIAQLQSQGNALANFKPITPSTSSTKSA